MFRTGIALFAFLHNVIDCVVFTFAIRDDFARKLISCFFGRAERTRGKLVCIFCAPSDTHTYTHTGCATAKSGTRKTARAVSLAVPDN